MDVKKTKRASLEKSKSVFTLFGLILTLSLVWSAFEHKTYDITATETWDTSTLEYGEDVILSTAPLKPPPPPPMQTTVLNIINTNDDLDDIIDIDIDIETDENEFIETQILKEQDEKTILEDEIVVFLEDQPEYPGGDKARLEYLAKAILYPEIAKEDRIQGTVYITFVVEKNGEISQVEVLRGIGGGCDEAAVNAIKGMPNWKAGKQRGRAVRAQFNMPIRFNLAE